MVKVDKVVTVTFDGADVMTLRSICELARVRIQEAGGVARDMRPARLGLTAPEYVAIEAMLTEIFETT